MFDKENLVATSLQELDIEDSQAGELAPQQTILEAGTDHGNSLGSFGKRFSWFFLTEDVGVVANIEGLGVHIQDEVSLSNKAEKSVDIEAGVLGFRTEIVHGVQN